MGGDYSRESFDPHRGFNGIGMQQGRIVTDADFNEFVAIVDRRMRALTVDGLGRAVVPKETPTGFEIRLAPGPKLSIGCGRMYLHGLAPQNFGRIGAPPARPILDRARPRPDGEPAGVLDEMISTQPNDFVDYEAQPYLPNPPALPATPGPHIAYLEVWEREVTAVKDPRLLEPALGGADTATRSQTVWQVRLLEDVGAGATCGSQSSKWDALIAPSAARLTTDTMDVEDPEDPCVIPPGGGYRGLENHFYRVEIHTGGTAGAGAGAAKFKWSRDNGSVATRIESIEPGNRVRVRSLGPDSTRQFAVGDWTEITDNHREYDGASGDMRRIVAISGTDEIELDAPLSPDLVPVSPDSTAARATRIIRWDHKGKVRFADGSLHIDLDTSTDGLIPVPAGGKAVQLEAGITVSFTTQPAGGVLRALDHWSFWARTEGEQIEILDAAPPVIHHHYARLAVVTFPTTVSDCRIFWPPAEECGCTVCVSAEAHNSGRLTIQAAIDKLPEVGGTVCLGPGGFILGDSPVVIARRQSVRLRGHGNGSQIAYAGPGGALRVDGSYDVRITDLAVLVAPVQAGEPGIRQSSAIHVHDSWWVTMSRTRLTLPPGGQSSDLGIALEGWIMDTAIDENEIEAPIAIGVLAAPRDPGPAGTLGRTGRAEICLLYKLRVADNILFASRFGIALEGIVLHVGPVHIEGNIIRAGAAGIRANGYGQKIGESSVEQGGFRSDACGVWICRNTISLTGNGDGIVSGVSDLKLLDNNIIGFPDAQLQRGGSCIRLVPNILPNVRPDGQIVGNGLGNVEGYALSVETPQVDLLVKRNLVRNCATGGIVTRSGASIQTLSLDNNVIEQVGTVRTGQAAAIAGVALNVLTEARIIGNTIRGVGQGTTGATYCAGLDIQGIDALIEVSHNVITDIGAEGRGGAVGVLVNGPILTCSITANNIFDGRAPGHAQTSWCGIFVGTNLLSALNPTGQPTVIGTSFDNLFSRNFLLNSLSFSSTPTAGAAAVVRGIATAAASSAAAFVPRAPQVRVSGNFVSAAQLGALLPLVRAGTDMATGSCCFTDNQCILRIAGTRAIVDLAASRLIVSNNVVRRGTADGLVMTLACRVVPQKPPHATIIGNITSGAIQLNGAATLPTPFVPLNVLSN